MTKQHPMIRGDVSADTAVRTLAALSGHSDVHLEQSVCYPYFKFDARCSLPTLFGRKESAVTCLVDAVSGKGATADHFNIDHLSSTEANVIDVSITRLEASNIAQRTTTHALGKRLRVVADFRLKLAAAELIYKRFWIVGNGQIRAMIDSVTGGMHPLPAGQTRKQCDAENIA